jgi:hypothetical protein
MSDALKIQIRVLYSCHTCGLTKASCDVPARAAEDVATWMDATIELLAADHRARSPGCTPVDGQLHDVMIPIGGADKVGGAPVQ